MIGLRQDPLLKKENERNRHCHPITIQPDIRDNLDGGSDGVQDNDNDDTSHNGAGAGADADNNVSKPASKEGEIDDDRVDVKALSGEDEGKHSTTRPSTQNGGKDDISSRDAPCKTNKFAENAPREKGTKMDPRQQQRRHQQPPPPLITQQRLY